MRQSAPPHASSLREFREVAIVTATSAGEVIAEHLGQGGIVELKSSPTDPVTDLDRLCAKRITDLLERLRPEDGVLSEEGTSRESKTGIRWVVDALDGSVNHLYGIPHCAVSVAAEARHEGGWKAIAGAVYDPMRRESFTAALGAGATVDNVPLRVNDPVPLPHALVATEFSYTAPSRLRQVGVLTRLLPEARDVRCTGSSALDLCWTAAGRFDAFYEDELYRWDWAAGRLILAESGGVTSDLGSGVCGAGPSLYRELAEFVAPDVS